MIDPYNTNRKVFAEGARVSETPLSSTRPSSKLLENGDATVDLPGVRKERRRMFRKLNFGAVPGYAPLCLDSNDPDTVWCAFAKRLFRDIPAPKQGILERFRVFVRGYVREHIPKVKPLGFEEWLLTTSYNEERKQQLREAFFSLFGGRPTKKTCSRISTFVKSEFYTEWKHARMINSRCDEFKVWSGPMFKAIEDAVYALPQYIKHVPVPDRPAAVASLKKAGRRYYVTDFVAYESHFTRALMDVCECELYRWCLSDTTEGEYLCQALMGRNRMRTRTGVKAQVKARRMSGDMCTSLGNGFTNDMTSKFIAHEKGGSVVGFVEGDDGIFASDVEITAKDYEDLGFTIKIQEVDDPCLASFCGMVFAESGQIVRDPRKFVMGFGWTQSFIGAGSKIMDELLRAKALSACYETPNCPIICAFARKALSVTRHAHPRFVHDGYHDLMVLPDVVNLPPTQISADTRLLFESLYGISIATQIEIEDAVYAGDMELIAKLMPPTPDQSNYASLYVVVT